MTPLQIEILLHYNSRAADYRNGDHSAPAVKDALNWFLEMDVIRHHGFKPEYFGDGQLKVRYELTSRGKAFVEYLQMIPLPTASWTFEPVSLASSQLPQHQRGTENV